MKICLNLVILFIVFSSPQILSQVPQSAGFPNSPTSDLQTEKLTQINDNISKINTSLKNMTESLKTFLQSFNSNQGLRLSDRQQRILLAFEILNRAEQRLSNLQRLKIELTEAQSRNRLQLARITDDLLPESIDRYVSTRGTTNSERLREIRRDALTKEKTELNKLIFDIQNNLEMTDYEIRQTENFIRNIRQRIFPEIEKELEDF